MPGSLLKSMVAEAIGAFALVFIGVLAIHSAGLTGGTDAHVVNLAAIGLAHGLAIAVMVAALGAISGGHFNPAVTFGFLVTGRMPVQKALLYWVAQIAGAWLAAVLVAAAIGTPEVANGTPALGTGIGAGQAILLEAVGTFFLVLVVFGTAVDERAPRNVYPLAIGLTIAIDIMAFGPLTGCAVNPARFMGPALESGHWADALVYWVGPLLGGGLAALLYNGLLQEKSHPLPVEAQGGPTEREQRGE